MLADLDPERQIREFFPASVVLTDCKSVQQCGSSPQKSGDPDGTRINLVTRKLQRHQSTDNIATRSVLGCSSKALATRTLGASRTDGSLHVCRPKSGAPLHDL